MGSRAQTRQKSKKPASARAKARDRRLLAKAEREAAEGARINASFAVIDAASAAPEGVPYVALPRDEVESVIDQLKELTHITIDAWACQGDFADGLETVLVQLHAARRTLESEMLLALERVGGSK